MPRFSLTRCSLRGRSNVSTSNSSIVSWPYMIRFRRTCVPARIRPVDSNSTAATERIIRGQFMISATVLKTAGGLAASHRIFPDETSSGFSRRGLLGPHSQQKPPTDASPSQLVAGRPDKGRDSHFKDERSGIECPAVVGIGFSRTGRCGREDVAELGALDVPTVQYILHAGNPFVLDGGEDRGLTQAGRLRSFRQREKYALSHRRPRSQRRRDVIPDPLARF